MRKILFLNVLRNFKFAYFLICVMDICLVNHGICASERNFYWGLPEVWEGRRGINPTEFVSYDRDAGERIVVNKIDSEGFCYDCLFDLIPSYTFMDAEFIPPLNSNQECSLCRNSSCYAGYVLTVYNNDREFLQRQLAYTKKYPKHQAYWLETSEKAKNISEMATSLFYELFCSTKLNSIELNSINDNFVLERDFPVQFLQGPIGECAYLFLTCTCFRFSDFYQVCNDLIRYSERHFTKAEQCSIADGTLKILDVLRPLFLDMYNESMTLHPTPEINEEIAFINLLYGNENNVEPCEYLANNFEKNKKHGKLQFNISANLNAKDFFNTPFSNQKVNFFSANMNFLKACFLSDSLLYQQALPFLTESIKHNPFLVDAYAERAYVYFELGCLKEAIQDYRMMEKLTKIHSRSDGITRRFSTCSYNLKKDVLRDGSTENKTEHFLPIEYAHGLCVGTCQGLGVAAVEFVPSVLSTLTGVGQGLWAFTCSPKEVSYELLQSSYACIDFLRSHTSEEILKECVPELKELFLTWDNLNMYDRGKQIGFVIGKYGVILFAPGTTAKAIRSYRNLKIANASLTIKLCAQSSEKASQILCESAQHLAMRKVLFKGKNLIIHKGNQTKHMPGKPNFQPGRSIITLSLEEVEKELQAFAGTGEQVGNILPGVTGYKERIDFGKVIGVWISDKQPTVQLPTTKGIIHYDSKGQVHLVPARPKQ